MMADTQLEESEGSDTPILEGSSTYLFSTIVNENFDTPMTQLGIGAPLLYTVLILARRSIVLTTTDHLLWHISFCSVGEVCRARETSLVLW